MRDLLQLVSVCREYLGLGHKAYICPVMVYDRQIPGIGLLELMHNAVHLLINIHIGGSRLHEIVYMRRRIEFLLEHIPSDVFQRHIALEMLSGIHHREYISL